MQWEGYKMLKMIYRIYLAKRHGVYSKKFDAATIQTQPLDTRTGV